MTDFYLKFADDTEAQSVLFDGERLKYRNTDTIGVIYKPTGNMIQTDEGEVPEMTPIDGWHVNVRLTADEDAAALEPFAVTPEPATPVRMWA